jgi:hypothetical protein
LAASNPGSLCQIKKLLPARKIHYLEVVCQQKHYKTSIGRLASLPPHGILSGMGQINPPDTHHLEAAEGWLGLGNHAEALAELDEISPELRSHPLVLELRWQINAGAEQWDACLDIAASLIQLTPERPFGWIHRAYALRRTAGGGLQTAYDSLLPAAQKFPEVAIIPYNLACYTCQMGDHHEARKWLEKAFARADYQQLKRMALDDPDLEPLWPELRKL